MAKKNKGNHKKSQTPPHSNDSNLPKRLGQMQANGSGWALTTTAIFTLADEARQTSQHDHSFWGNESKLRAKPVKFTSAGLTEPLEPADLLESTGIRPKTGGEDSEEQDDEETVPMTGPNANIVIAPGPESNENPAAETENETVARMPFYYDIGQKVPHRVNAAPQNGGDICERQQSDGSSGSEEVILFKGRSKASAQERSDISLVNVQREIRAVEKELHEKGVAVKQHQLKKQRRKRGGQHDNRHVEKKAEEEDSMLADYIANMRENGELEAILSLADEVHQSTQASRGSTSRAARTYPTGMPGGSDSESSSLEDPASDNLEELDCTEFDPMDWERPTLRRRKGKGRSAKLNLQFADLDPETEQRLQAAWKSDRLKKAERKRDRESLRAVGLLSKKANINDARIKHPTGMSAQEVSGELKDFLLSSDSSLCFPPMGKNVRKLIHELANKFNIKSKSIGNGDQRRPVLYRTNRTLSYNDATFDQAVGRVSRRYFPRLDSKTKGGGGGQQSGRNGYAAASYRDGEVVGAAAPELGIENRGRAMLEKMGWSSGTPLGTTDNKGILHPVTQTMKRSKAGLG